MTSRTVATWFALVFIGAVFFPRPASAVLAWGNGPYWSASFTATSCTNDIPAGHTPWRYTIICAESLGGQNEGGSGFYFSDDTPGLMVFQTQYTRDVRNFVFRSTDNEFTFSLPGGFRFISVEGGPSMPRTVQFGSSGTIDYRFTVVNRSPGRLSGTFTSTRQFLALCDQCSGNFLADYRPYIGQATVTGTWSAYTVSSLPSPAMNGYDACDAFNGGFNYNIGFSCYPTGSESYPCPAVLNACVYNDASGGGAIELHNPLSQVLLASNKVADPVRVAGSPVAKAISADGVSAAVVMVVAQGTTPITLSAAPYGTLTPFQADYIVSPKPGGSPTLPGITPYRCDSKGMCTFLALLWPPNWPDASNLNPLRATITVSGTRSGQTLRPATTTLQLPPVLLVHGIWSSAQEAGFAAGSGGLFDWLRQQYGPGHPMGAVDYGWNLTAGSLIFGRASNKSFADPLVQTSFELSARKLLSDAATAGTVARQLDVVGHSMGGLVTRYFANFPSSTSLPSGIVHSLVTIGTPHTGSKLATELDLHKSDLPCATCVLVKNICSLSSPPINPCTMSQILASKGKVVDTGVTSLRLGLSGSPLANALPYKTIVGRAPSNSLTGGLLNQLVGSFLPGKTVTSILDNELNDTIVAASSQSAGGLMSATIPDVVHTLIAGTAEGETASHAVWSQVYVWLTGQGAPPVFAAEPSVGQKAAVASAVPSFDLNGYTEVPASNFASSPANLSSTTVGAPLSINVTSSTKTISEVWVLQTVMDPTDTPALTATAAPFTVAFTPKRLGSLKFVAFVLFNDLTYAVAPLEYVSATSAPLGQFQLEPTGNINLVKGTTASAAAVAVLPGLHLDVTAQAQYVVRSGTSNVISLGSGNQIIALAEGIDYIDVTYAGIKISSKITVSAPLNYAVGVTKRGSGSGNVSSSDTLLDCGASCTYGYSASRTVLMTATPAAGSVFTGWLGDCTGTSICKLTLNGNANVAATFALSPSNSRTLDLDQNSRYHATTDGLLALRYLVGLTGASLTQGATDPQGLRTGAAEVVSYLEDIRPKLDIDGNGQATASTDGLLLLRYLFGLRGQQLIAGAIGPGATRTSAAEIEAYISGLMP